MRSNYWVHLQFRNVFCRGNKLLEPINTVLKPYSNKTHYVYTDNYYNSVQTSEILLQNIIRTSGTIRINRGVPEPLGKAK